MKAKGSYNNNLTTFNLQWQLAFADRCNCSRELSTYHRFRSIIFIYSWPRGTGTSLSQP